MNRPPVPHMMGNMYRSPRPYNNQWRPRGPRPNTGFQWRGNSNFRPRPVLHSPNQNNEEHWCETCDRGFPSTELLNNHMQQHQKCNIDGCQFVAHPKVITKHIQMQHSSGLYKKIAKLDNPEEIQKWREERKKKYPTRTNIEKKAAECKEKIERGEKMALKRSRSDHKSTDQTIHTKRRENFDKRNQNNRNNKPKFDQKQNRVNNQNQARAPAPKKPRAIPSIPSVIEKNKLKPFAGILSINMEDDHSEDVSKTSDCSNNLIEDDFYEEPVTSTEIKHNQKSVICGALSTLMCDYGSSDDETNEKENTVTGDTKTAITVENENKQHVDKTVEIVNEVTIKDMDKGNSENNIGPVNMESITKDEKTECNDVAANVIQQIDKNQENSDNDSGPEEVTTVKSEIVEPNSSLEQTSNTKVQPLPVKKNLQQKNDHRQNNKFKRKVPSTLLYKLLHKEIRQERNIVLQCIRYIKKMNYFDKTSQ